MGKETKIGLAVIGVLLSVFGVLLFRHLSITRPSASKWSNEASGPAQPLAAEPSKNKPNVVAAQGDPAQHGGNEPLWGSRPGPASPRGQVPSASYMPDAAETDGAAARLAKVADDGNSPDAEPAPESLAADPPIGTSPFQNRAPASGDAPPAELPNQDSTGQARRNPLRRLSAELPLNGPEQTADPLPNESASDEIPAAPVDPYGEQPAPPADADIPPATDVEGATDPAQPLAPSSGGLPDPFPDELGDQPSNAPPANMKPREAQPEPAVPQRMPTPAGNPRARTQDDWQPGAGAALPERTQPERSQPVPLENGMYVVQPNDTLWSVSEKVYGTGGYFKALAAHNRANLPRSDQLSVGMRVAAPPVAELEQKYPSLCPKQRRSALVAPRAAAAAPARSVAGSDVYVVAEGDTLFDIARFELGKATRWAEIYELNRDKLGEDFDYLQPGLELQLPARSEAAETISRRDANALR